MNNRLALAIVSVALLGALAGCSAAGSLSMEPVDDEQLADSASRSVENASVNPVAQGREVARRAIENGSTTVVADSPPVRTGLPYRHDGRFYNLSRSVLGTEPGYRIAVEIDYNASTVEGTVVDYDDLPAVDRRALAPLVDRQRRALEPGYDFGLPATYTESEAEASVLVTDQEVDAVRYEGEVYPVNANGPESVTLEVYRHEATPVADSPEAYAEDLKATYAFTLSGLSDAESDVVAEAITDTYYAEDDDDEAFASLVERFRAHDPVVSRERTGKWVVRYDGQLYWAEMDYWGFVSETPDASVTEPEATPPPE